MYYIKAIALSVILLGCTSPRIETKVTYPLPDPVDKSQIKWQVITKETMRTVPDNAVYVGLSWDDQLKHRQYLEDLLNYIKQQQTIICKYQTCE